MLNFKTSENFQMIPITNIERDAAMDYLRSFLIMLVVCDHAAMGYVSFNLPDLNNFINLPMPVSDTSRWPLIDIFVGFNDTFFMSLFFLISGIFSISTIRRSGPAAFLVRRLQRLGIPWVILVVIARIFQFEFQLYCFSEFQLYCFQMIHSSVSCVVNSE